MSCTSHLPALIDIRHSKVAPSNLQIQQWRERELSLQPTLVGPGVGILNMNLCTFQTVVNKKADPTSPFPPPLDTR